MSNTTMDGTGNVTMFGTANTTSTPPLVAPSPVVEIKTTESVDLHHVAYRRDDTPYDKLLAALLEKVSSLQQQLRNLT